MEAIQGIAAATLGFWFYTVFTHPNKFLNSKIPKIKLKAVEFLPNLRIKIKKNTIWVHHWISLSIILAILTFKAVDFTHLLIVKSFILGGAIQGITFKDRFKILQKTSLIRSNLKKTSKSANS